MIKYALMIILGMFLVVAGCGKDVELRSMPGPKGDIGEKGPAGEVGPSGSPGVDATPVTIVKLCPGTTAYPSVFVEIAFCFTGKLYGTYSQNGGFSTELPPGTYSSNAIGSKCNFTIGANCQVTQL